MASVAYCHGSSTNLKEVLGYKVVEHQKDVSAFLKEYGSTGNCSVV